MRNKIGNVLWGLFFIFLGLGLAGRFLWGWNFTLFFNGWWTLFIIIPCIISIIESGIRVPNLFGTILGILLFLSCQDGIGYIFSWKLIWPLMLIAVGICIIISPFTGKHRYNKTYDNTTNKTTYSFQKKMNVCFGERRFSSAADFDGCELSCSFGSMTVDLINAKITQDCTIECHNSFGQTVILVPSDVNVQIYIEPVLGSVDNRVRNNINTPELPTLLIQGDCSFGQILVK